MVSGVISPYDLSGLAAGAAFDVQVQSSNAAGTSAWSVTSTLTTAATGINAPNAPTITGVSPPADGTNSKLVVTWTVPTVDGTHGAATGYNLRSSPSGAGIWTIATAVTSPYTLTGLGGATAIDVEVQATNASATPGAWSVVTTGTTWGCTVVWGTWSPGASQVHNTPVAPNTGVNIFAVAAPTAVTATVFAWSAGNSVVPTTNLIATTTDGQTNGWGQWFTAPSTTGTFYLWALPQDAGGAVIGALVSSSITVS
jgi:hypothetical protein